MFIEESFPGGASKSSSTFQRAFQEAQLTLPICVVAIPVKDEADRLPHCLAALADQRDKSGAVLDRALYGIVVCANNCCDESADLAREIGKQLSLNLRVVEMSLPPRDAHAGGARRAAMDIAEQWLASANGQGGVLLTTDADSQVSSTWIFQNLKSIAAGADAVLGTIELDEEGDRLPEALHRRGRLESAYEALLVETSAFIDPVLHDPWPRHSTISGASLAVTRRAYLDIGGLPAVPLGEDKALVTALMRIDAKVRHSNDVRVTTSGRCYGRAPGGVADTLRLRGADPSAPCDEALEPYRVAFLRAKWKRKLRLLWASRNRSERERWQQALLVSPNDADRAFSAPNYGAVWDEIERSSGRLIRKPLSPFELPREISLAARTLDRLRRQGLAANDEIETKSRMAIRPFDDALAT